MCSTFADTKVEFYSGITYDLAISVGTGRKTQNPNLTVGLFAFFTTHRI